MVMRTRRTTLVRLLVIAVALLVVCLHTRLQRSRTTLGGGLSQVQDHRTGYAKRQLSGKPSNVLLEKAFEKSRSHNRRLFSVETMLADQDDDDIDVDNCTDPLEQNNTCSFVYEYCSEDVQLFNYLGFVACILPDVKPVAYIILVIWLIYLISLIGTTADYFFVPPLTLLSDKLKLSDSIAGITLLAIGNGAPDVFTAYSALQRENLALLLGALIGSSIFIFTIVLGSVLVVSKITRESIDKIDFMRDIIAYSIVVAVVVSVAYDGIVALYEAVLFPVLYLLYIAVVVLISYLRKWWKSHRKKQKSLNVPPIVDSSKHPVEDDSSDSNSKDETTGLLSDVGNGPIKKPAEEKSLELGRMKNSSSNGARKHSGGGDVETSFNANSETTPLLDKNHNEQKSDESSQSQKKPLQLSGLTIPKRRILLIQWALELPFSLLRWLTIPSCYHDGQWTVWHMLFITVSPIPASLLLLLVISHFEGFLITLGDSEFPLYGLLVIIGFLLSMAILIYFIVTKGRPPHWALQGVLALMGFVMAIAWLDLVANELVSVLEALGLAFNIDSAFLGLTVLAIGNSVADWIADLAVARADKPVMAISSCFGSPLLKDVLGYSLAFIVKIGIQDSGRAFTFDIHKDVYSKVKLSWIFLAISLALSFVVFPLFRFKPPKEYGIVLCYIYFVFLLFSILDTTGVMPIHL